MREKKQEQNAIVAEIRAEKEEQKKNEEIKKEELKKFNVQIERRNNLYERELMIKEKLLELQLQEKKQKDEEHAKAMSILEKLEQKTEGRKEDDVSGSSKGELFYFCCIFQNYSKSIQDKLKTNTNLVFLFSIIRKSDDSLENPTTHSEFVENDEEIVNTIQMLCSNPPLSHCVPTTWIKDAITTHKGEGRGKIKKQRSTLEKKDVFATFSKNPQNFQQNLHISKDEFHKIVNSLKKKEIDAELMNLLKFNACLSKIEYF